MFYKTSFENLCPRSLLWVLALGTIFCSRGASTSDILNPRHFFVFPGEPLNPDDVARGSQYRQNLAAGIIQEPEYDETGEQDELTEQKSPPKIWSGRRIPYLINKGFTDVQRAVIHNAAKDITSKTCLTLMPKTTEKDYVNIMYVNGSGCHSKVGREGGAQEFVLGQDFCFRIGTVVHEFLHALGFNHEHQRKDRDYSIRIYKKYVDENNQNQILSIRKFSHNTLTSYDYGSIMHYGERAFCIKGCPPGAKTIEKRNKSSLMLGQREKMSQKDILRAKLLYKCGKKPKNPKATMDRKAGKLQGCKDFHAHCPYATSEDCQSNTWVKFMCRRTCNTCRKTDCANYNDKCKEWSRNNYCYKIPEYMLLYCRKACRVCTS